MVVLIFSVHYIPLWMHIGKPQRSAHGRADPARNIAEQLTPWAVYSLLEELGCNVF